MTNIQRAFCVVLSLIFLCVVAALPGDFFRHGEVYRSLPLYCFLEKKALQEENGRDLETEMLLQEKNAEHLGEEVAAENRREQEELLMAEAEKDAADSRDEGQEETRAEKDKIVDESKSGVEEKEEKEEKEEQEEQETVALPHPQIDLSQAKLADFDYVMNHFFILDSNTETNAGQISGTRFLEEDMSIKQDSSVPQILIYHTHSQETFSDSREGETEDTIVGVGNYLTDILEKNYGYKVIHVTDAFDIMGGELDRSKAYDYARSSIEKVLEENPTVEVVIDLHRDGVPDDRHLVTEINGKQTAQILFYNGLSYTVNQGAVSYLPNPYIEDNLAFSFQLEYQAAQYYPQFYRGIYLAGLRYNLHLRPRALLLEAGAQTNTVEEVRNAMEPFADILNRVLKGSDKEG
ncbi:stage II sporulation protein P [Blautia schinkii]|uniref:stage II sporulation protein P n=1 Tax=Blautia schinkii TaxID=180164 RepID=UPI002ED0CE12